MQKPVYDLKSDSIYFKIRSGKVYESMELSSHILVDLSLRNNSIIGIEILGASIFLSSLTSRKIDKDTIKNRLLIYLPPEDKEEVKLGFSLGNEKYVYAIPKLYTSPIVAGC